MSTPIQRLKTTTNWIYKWVLDGRGTAGHLLDGMSIASEMRKYYIFPSIGKTLIHRGCLFSLAKLNFTVKIKTKNSKRFGLHHGVQLPKIPKCFHHKVFMRFQSRTYIYELSLRSHNHVISVRAVCFNWKQYVRFTFEDNNITFFGRHIHRVFISFPKFRIKL